MTPVDGIKSVAKATPWGAIIGAGSSLIDGLLGTGNRQNMKMAEYAYSKDLEMWNRNNAYNDPSAQMKRLENAGLNKNMVYGSGTVAGNTSGQMPKYNAPTQKAPKINPLEAMGVYQNMQQQKAQTDLIKAQTDNAYTEAGIKKVDLGLKELALKRGDIDFMDNYDVFHRGLRRSSREAGWQTDIDKGALHRYYYLNYGKDSIKEADEISKLKLQGLRFEAGNEEDRKYLRDLGVSMADKATQSYVLMMKAMGLPLKEAQAWIKRLFN